ncbi:hypothetical protein N658DRAFT_328290 [Parathielavia hyrcaniae]|uniref:Uncharacterized protein n=1 Tax=Parathielavia hyrcaniae TaxID=113614 RepID=A0AAN6Q4W9_9PEZI|nr:hypothetical protein N658DRAFT_328290 [Parathielavia hyrcaniae]
MIGKSPVEAERWRTLTAQAAIAPGNWFDSGQVFHGAAAGESKLLAQLPPMATAVCAHSSIEERDVCLFTNKSGTRIRGRSPHQRRLRVNILVPCDHRTAWACLALTENPAALGKADEAEIAARVNHSLAPGAPTQRTFSTYEAGSLAFKPTSHSGGAYHSDKVMACITKAPRWRTRPLRYVSRQKKI